MGAEAKAERVAAAPAPADSKASDELFAKLKEKVAPPVAEAKGEEKPDEPKLNYVQRQEKRIKERQERLAAAAEAKAAEEAKYADEKPYDAGRWSNAQGSWDQSGQQWDQSQWESTNYDTAGYEQSHYDTAGYEQSQYTYDEATQYHASQYEGGGYDESQYATEYDQSVYTEAIPEEGQYEYGQSVYTNPQGGIQEEPSAFGGDARTIETLLRHGADPHVKDSHGRACVDLFMDDDDAYNSPIAVLLRDPNASSTTTTQRARHESRLNRSAHDALVSSRCAAMHSNVDVELMDSHQMSLGDAIDAMDEAQRAWSEAR